MTKNHLFEKLKIFTILNIYILLIQPKARGFGLLPPESTHNYKLMRHLVNQGKITIHVASNFLESDRKKHEYALSLVKEAMPIWSNLLYQLGVMTTEEDVFKIKTATNHEICKFYPSYKDIVLFFIDQNSSEYKNTYQNEIDYFSDNPSCGGYAFPGTYKIFVDFSIPFSQIENDPYFIRTKINFVDSILHEFGHLLGPADYYFKKDLLESLEGKKVNLNYLPGQPRDSTYSCESNQFNNYIANNGFDHYLDAEIPGIKCLFNFIKNGILNIEDYCRVNYKESYKKFLLRKDSLFYLPKENVMPYSSFEKFHIQCLEEPSTTSNNIQFDFNFRKNSKTGMFLIDGHIKYKDDLNLEYSYPFSEEVEDLYVDIQQDGVFLKKEVNFLGSPKNMFGDMHRFENLSFESVDVNKKFWMAHFSLWTRFNGMRKNILCQPKI